MLAAHPGDAVAVARRRLASPGTERVVVRGDSDENPDGAAGQRSGTWPPSSSASHATRAAVDAEGREDSLAGRDAEEVGIELVDALQESAAARDSPGPFEVRAVPARVRDRADRLRAVSQQLPERRGPVCAGEPAADADDRDRLADADRRDDFWPARASSRQDSPARKPRQRVDRGIVIDECRGELTAEPLLQLGREPHRLQRADAKARQRRAHVDLIGPDARAARRPLRPARPRSRPARASRRRRDRCGQRRASIDCVASAPVPRRARRRILPVSTRRRRRATRPGTPRGRRGAEPSRSTSSGRLSILINRIAWTSMSCCSATARRIAAMTSAIAA